MRFQNVKGIVVSLVVVVGVLLLFRFAPEDVGGEIMDEQGSGTWELLLVSLPDITDLAFDSSGQVGAVVSIDGELLLTQDGGISWHRSSVPIDEGDMANAVGVSEDGRIIVGVGVDESSYTAIYELKGGEWIKLEGDYGGISASTTDGSILVGAAGLIAQKQSEVWVFNRLPSFGQRMLYGVAAYGEKIVVVGDDGGVFLSTDNGREWKQCKIDFKGKSARALPIYKAALSKDLLIVGGANALWRSVCGKWGEIKGLDPGQSVYALNIDREGKQVFAAGGDDAGGSPFIIHSTDAGRTWQTEVIDPGAKGRITGLARSSSTIYAGTSDGRILVRRSSMIAEN